MTTSLHLYFI